MTTRRIAAGVLLGLFLVPFMSLGCKRAESTSQPAGTGGEAQTTASAGPVGELKLPEMDVDRLPLAVKAKIGEARYQIKREPTDPVKIGELGALCYVHGFPDVAVMCFKRATELAPNEAGWWYYLGRASERVKDKVQARAAYAKVLAINKEYEAATLRIAALGTVEGAGGPPTSLPTHPVTDPLEEGLLLQGLDLRALLRAALALAQSGQFPQAQEYLKRARDVDVSGIQSRETAARMLLLQGKLDDAVRELEKAIESAQGRELTMVKIDLARLYVLRKDYDQTERLIREAVAEDPNSAEAANILAWMLAASVDPARRNAEEAVKWAEKACTLTKYQDDALLDTLAAAYAAVGRYDDAVKWIDEAIRLAEQAKRPSELPNYQARRKLYAAGQPYFGG